MRLYLSSYKFGNYTDELVKLAGDNKKVAIITNAVDYGDRDRVLASLSEDIKVFNSLGFQAEELNLKKYFGKQELLKEHLANFGMVWVRGGNTFILKRAFEQSGFDVLIKELLNEDKIVYGGYSAGIVILAPSMKGLELVDDPNIVPDGYKPEFSWDGLNILDYAVCVHYRSDHPESEMVEKEVEYYKENGTPYKTLRDGEVIVVNN